MEINKKEAEKCLELAERFIKERNREEAETLLRKAKHLYPSPKVEFLLFQAQLLPLNRLSENQPQNSENEKSSFATLQYTLEQLEAVERIIKCKNYYEVLQVSRKAHTFEIKKAYKKLALKLHPDKNKSPRAAQAFNTLSNAAAVLMDPRTRVQHDMAILDEELLGTKIFLDGKNKVSKQFTHNSDILRNTSCKKVISSPKSLEELFNMLLQLDLRISSFKANKKYHSNENIENNPNSDDVRDQKIEESISRNNDNLGI